MDGGHQGSGAVRGASRLSNESPAIAFFAISFACIIIAQAIAYVATSFEFPPNEIAWLAVLSFGFQWIVFLPSFYILKSAAYFDVAGSSAYFVLSLYSLVHASTYHLRQLLVTMAVMVWACRLGVFLYLRVQKAGGDSRFDEIKHHGPRFFNMWSIQALWVFVVSVPVYCLNDTLEDSALDTQDCVGLALWLIGFTIEVIADMQKTAHNADPATKGTFIQTGLWRFSRHPNYFGEILLWIGVLVVCTSVFTGGQWVCLCSPIFVTYLLTKVSGIPLLENKASAKWGLQADYKAYIARTPQLIPWYVEPPAESANDLGAPIMSPKEDEITQV
jgi:steroid 5-alpha reductase family enzyme